jgi:hypothetical protein
MHTPPFAVLLNSAHPLDGFGRIIRKCDPSGSLSNLRLAVAVKVVALRAA